MGNICKIKPLLHKLPLNCAAGKDGILLSTFFCWFKCAITLSGLFNVCLVHGKIPNACMQTVIVPICKNKNEDITDAGNYRPASLATIIFKSFQHYILSCISPFVATTDNQFGFKPHDIGQRWSQSRIASLDSHWGLNFRLKQESVF